MKKFPSIFKIPSYKTFFYEPRYYDPIKEDIKKREQKIKLELKRKISDSSLSGDAFQYKMSSYWAKHRQREHKSIGIRLVLVVIITFLIFLFFSY